MKKQIVTWIISKCIKLGKLKLDDMDLIVYNSLRKDIEALREAKKKEERENFTRFYKIEEYGWGSLSDQIAKLDPEAIKFIKNN
jgi:hypothetical protein